MVFFLLILLAVTVAGARLCGPGEFNTDYLDKKNTTAVNGIFVVLVLFSHYAQYADLGGSFDMPYLALRHHLGQMVVATFLLYSGYGMMEAIRRKGDAYVRKILSKFWQLLFRFDLAVLLYLAANLILKIHFPVSEVLLAFTTWTAIGNSNWYITAVLILYVIMYISFRICLSGANDAKKRYAGIALTFVLTAAAVCVQILIDRPAYCYNTMLLLPLGCLYSEARPKIESFVMRSDMVYLVTLTAAAGIYVIAYLSRKTFGLLSYTIWGVAFIALVLLVTMKLQIYNRVLEWLGRHIFGIYILQRLPMTVLDQLGLIEDHKYMSLIVVMAATFVMAALFQKYTEKMIRVMTRG